MKPSAKRDRLRYSTILIGASVVLVACSSGQPTVSDTRADGEASTALNNSQSGSIEVIEYVTNDLVDGMVIDLSDSPDASISLDTCVQLDIARWRLTGEVDAANVPTQGWLRFRAGAQGPDTALRVRIVASGAFLIEVPAASLTDLASVCRLTYSDEDSPHAATESAASPFEGVFTWDARSGTVSSLGEGLVAGSPSDPRRGWAEQYWFGLPLPFGDVLAVDKTLVGFDPVQRIDVGQTDGTPCQQVNQIFAQATLTQSQSCTSADGTDVYTDLDVEARWVQFGQISGLSYSAQGRHFIVGSAGGYGITIVAGDEGAAIELAAALKFYSNDAVNGPQGVGAVFPRDEDDLVGDVTGGVFREIGRVDTSVGRFLVTEGPLNPSDPADYLQQLRIYRLQQGLEFWNPVLVSGGPWDRCLGATALGEDHTFIITGDSAATVSRPDGSTFDQIESSARIHLVAGQHTADQTEIRISDETIDCSTIVAMPLPRVTTTSPAVETTDTTSGDGSTDGTVAP